MSRSILRPISDTDTGQEQARFESGWPVSPLCEERLERDVPSLPEGGRWPSSLDGIVPQPLGEVSRVRVFHLLLVFRQPINASAGQRIPCSDSARQRVADASRRERIMGGGGVPDGAPAAPCHRLQAGATGAEHPERAVE